MMTHTAGKVVPQGYAGDIKLKSGFQTERLLLSGTWALKPRAYPIINTGLANIWKTYFLNSR